jgi:hemerythrin superfamily protein
VTDIEIPRPTEGDVVDLILADHRLFEDLLRRVRDETQDRVAIRQALADLLTAHAEAEERYVYPELVRDKAVEEDDTAHSTHEHLEINEALLTLLGVDDVASDAFDRAEEGLTKAVAHHLDEEEREILNPARTGVPDDVRADLGRTFAGERNRQLDAGAGTADNVRRLIAAERARAQR